MARDEPLPDEPLPDEPPPPERPQPPAEPEAGGIPDHASDTSTSFDTSERPRFDDSPPSLPADAPQAVDEPGVTGEPAAGEPLAERLAREEPDVTPEAPPVRDEPVGRLSAPDQGVGPDTEKDAFADERGEAGGGLSAEEAAMHDVPQGGEAPAVTPDEEV